ncbi:MAG: hypothetical protein AAGI37_14735 [Planctomycetota bacterium]
MSSSATAALADIVSSLFTEPLKGFNDAQIQIVDHWVRLLGQFDTGADPAEYATALKMAPKWSASLRGDVSIVLRLATLKQTKAGVSLGVGVGPFQASGSFGFMSETASESVIQARAAYVVSNDAGEVGLVDVLKDLGIVDPLDPGEVENAVAKLGTLQNALPALPGDDGEG